MRKNITLILFALLSLNAISQITFEQSYPGPSSPAWARLQLINMGNNDFKFVIVDFSTNQIKLYNLNHSPYVTINVPVVLISEAEHNIGYISKSLFDCDSSKFEYAILPQNGNNNFYIYREDGTLLFKKDSTLAPYCFGCFGGAYDVRPILNSPAGAKLFLSKSTPTGFMTTDVYSLCGDLPENITELNDGLFSYVKVFPNPSTGKINFEFDLPGNTQTYEIQIFDSSGKAIKTTKIQQGEKKRALDDGNLSSGLYFYTLHSEDKIIQNGKFIISK